MVIKNILIYKEEIDFGMDIDYLYDSKTDKYELIYVDYIKGVDLVGVSFK